MTNELEKHFFSTFGIEPRYEDACTVEDKYWNNEELANEYGTFDQYMNCKCGNQENCTTECSCAYQREVYPQITDRILLELICILTKRFDYADQNWLTKCNDTKELKVSVLRLLLLCPTSIIEEYKQQVRTLFEEG